MSGRKEALTLALSGYNHRGMRVNACAPRFERRWDALMVEAARVQVYRDAARRPLRDQQAQRLCQPRGRPAWASADRRWGGQPPRQASGPAPTAAGIPSPRGLISRPIPAQTWNQVQRDEVLSGKVSGGRAHGATAAVRRVRRAARPRHPRSARRARPPAITTTTSPLIGPTRLAKRARAAPGCRRHKPGGGASRTAPRVTSWRACGPTENAALSCLRAMTHHGTAAAARHSPTG